MGMGQIVDYSQFILQLEKAIANGVATLDSNAKVPKNQIDLIASDVGAISVGGESGTALKLTTPRTISATGDATYSVSFDGSANVSAAITLANSGVVAGTYNALATQVRPFSVDSKGRITGIGTPINITPPWSAITGTPTTLAGYGITNALPLSGGTVTGQTVFSNTTPSTSPTTGAIVVSGGQGVGGNQHVAGFSSFGGTTGGHPAIKLKTIEGTTAAIEGGTVEVAHGVLSTKIISITAFVKHVVQRGVSNGYVFAVGYQFDIVFTDTNVIIYNHQTNSENILSKPFIVTIIYKE